MSDNFFKINKGILLNPQTVEPTGTDGEVYYNDSLAKFRIYENGAWKDLAGGGASSFDAIAGENLTAGDALYISIGASDGGRTAGRVYKLDPTNDLRHLFVGVAAATVLSGATVTVSVAGEVTGLSGLVAGQIVFASTSTPGAYQTLIPTTKGHWVVSVGVAKSTSSFVIDNIGSVGAFKLGHRKSEDTNYVLNPDFENNNVTGWIAYEDASPGRKPTGATVGAGDISINITATSPIAEKYSAQLSRPASNAQGDGVYYSFSIDRMSLAKVLQITFDYDVSAGTFAAKPSSGDSDITVWIYDVDNATIIEPSNVWLFSNSSTVPGRYEGSFQTSSNSLNYRLLLHCSTTTATAFSLRIDNVRVGPSAYVFGTPVNDWYAWDFDGSWVTNTTYTGFRRRVGDTEEFQVKVSTSGAPNSANLTINLPVTIDTAKIFGEIDNQTLGVGSVHDAGLNYKGPVTVGYESSTSVQVRYALENGDAQPVILASVNQASPMVFAAGDEVFLRFSVPVLGQSSSVQTSDNADTRVVAARATVSTVFTIPNVAFTTVVYGTEVYDTHSAYNPLTGEFTAPVAGKYNISATALTVATAGWNTGEHIELAVFKNGINQGTLGGVYAAASYTGRNTASGSLQVECGAGDVLTVRCYQDSGASVDLDGSLWNTVSIERVSGPSAIAAIEKILAYYNGTVTGTIAATFNPVTFPSQVIDTHGAFSGATFTAPASGLYRLRSQLFISGTFLNGHAIATTIRVNGVERAVGVFRWTASVTNSSTVSADTYYRLQAGDTVQVGSYSDGSANSFDTANAHHNQVMIERVG